MIHRLLHMARRSKHALAGQARDVVQHETWAPDRIPLMSRSLSNEFGNGWWAERVKGGDVLSKIPLYGNSGHYQSFIQGRCTYSNYRYCHCYIQCRGLRHVPFRQARHPVARIFRPRIPVHLLFLPISRLSPLNAT